MLDWGSSTCANSSRLPGSTCMSVLDGLGGQALRCPLLQCQRSPEVGSTKQAAQVGQGLLRCIGVKLVRARIELGQLSSGWCEQGGYLKWCPH